MKSVIKKKINNSTENKVLKNYFKTNRDFYAIFPSETFDFSESKFTHYLYFDEEEGKEYLLDFMKFIKTYYSSNIFSCENFYAIFAEFEKYLKRHNVYLTLKTNFALKVASGNTVTLLKTLTSLWDKVYFATDNENNPTKIAFIDSLIANKKEYTFDFFNYLEEKTKCYNNNKLIIEPLVEEDREKILGYFKGISFDGKVPFFLKNKFKHLLIDKITNNIVTNTYIVGKQTLDIVGLIFVQIDNNIATISIYCEYEYYDIDFSEAVQFVCFDLFSHHNVEKIKTINENKSLAYSNLNTVLTICRFKPEYTAEKTFEGYSKIKYEMTKEIFEDIGFSPNNSIIKFAF